MKKPDSIDELLRESLINWALEELHHPTKLATLEHMSKPDWLHFLYSEEVAKKVQGTQPKEAAGSREQVSTPPEFVEEEWAKTLLKELFYGLKRAYHAHFPVQKWGMRRINTTGMYVLGPVNAFGEIFFRFKIGVKNKIVYWDLENHRGKIRPKGFEAVPRVILGVLQARQDDLLIRKISKSFGVMHHSGTSAKQALSLLLAAKEENIGIGNDAHGGLWIQEGKKKHFPLSWEESDGLSCWVIYGKTSHAKLASFATKEEFLACCEALNLPKTFPRKKSY